MGSISFLIDAGALKSGTERIGISGPRAVCDYRSSVYAGRPGLHGQPNGSDFHCLSGGHCNDTYINAASTWGLRRQGEACQLSAHQLVATDHFQTVTKNDKHVERIAGHKDATRTLNTYAELFEDDFSSAEAGLDSLLVG